MNKRLFIEKEFEFSGNKSLLETLKRRFNLSEIHNLRRINIYDVFNCPEELLTLAVSQVFSDPVVDNVLAELPKSDHQIVFELLPGLYDQRADSAEQCLRALDERFANTRVLCARAWLIDGQLSTEQYREIRDYLINPLECRIKNLDLMKLPTVSAAEHVKSYERFLEYTPEELREWHKEQALAMTVADLYMVQLHFKAIERVPKEAEIRVLDTYWSDHCRHTTFSTELKEFSFPESAFGQFLESEYRRYQETRARVFGEKALTRPQTLMELATIDARLLKALGMIEDVEFSQEINACSVFVDVQEEGEEEKTWLLQFKNETHNHPTEIEPFGGAATCVGGAIRDPLAGRAYVYQGMRISAGSDPREALADTMKGKLPQVQIAQESANGYSSYGNQIGLATGKVVEYYHPDYKAKHMELGAVVGAVPYENVQRLEPKAGDVVLLVGGATGRDGCGGATGSSKTQHQQSLEVSAAEVQKGNAPEERKLQRLFRNPDFSRRIKRCNDFGAGGVAVAVGEIAAGLDVQLDAIPVKYQGLSGTELAISESQERMAVLVDASDVEEMIKLAAGENLTATAIAVVNNDDVLRMFWRGEEIVNLSRQFLDTNGAPSLQELVSFADVNLSALNDYPSDENWHETLCEHLRSLSFADQRSLGDRFDHSVGASCVLLPYGGKTQRSPSEASVYLLPTNKSSKSASILAHGFQLEKALISPYHGGLYAVMEASARLVASGGNIEKTHYSLQEYFRRLGENPENWGQVYAALLGAHKALNSLQRPAIGGKDSMSGSFQDLQVPPTLVAFAVTAINSDEVISPEFKAPEHHLFYLRCPSDEHFIPDFKRFQENNNYLNKHRSKIASARAIRQGGLIQALYECALGNNLGVKIRDAVDLFKAEFGGYLISSPEHLPPTEGLEYLGKTTAEALLQINNQSIELEKLHQIASDTLDSVYQLYPEKNPQQAQIIPLAHVEKASVVLKQKTAQPRVCVAVFPGTNSELDTARAFTRAGGIVNEALIRNRNAQDIRDSMENMVNLLKNSQIFVVPGGFSAGDEPDGSGKFIANLLASPSIKSALEEFLQRDGLILGICNGFQALIKCGLLPDGVIKKPKKGAATLLHNDIERHISRVASTVVANNHSPWLRNFQIGEIHDVDFSHGEGRFYASPEILQKLINNGQIAFQYANPESGEASMAPIYNPNGSLYAVEGLISPCGRILGKMGHSERHTAGTHKNYPNFRAQDIFSAGISAFH